MGKIMGLMAVFVLALTLGASATLVWTDAGQWHGTDTDVTNWWDTVTGAYPTSDQVSGTMSNFVGGILIADTGIANGDLHIGDNALVITNMNSQMVNGTIKGNSGSTISITDCNTTITKTFAVGVAITMNDNSWLKLTGTGNPLSAATVALNSITANLQLSGENVADFLSEHVNKVTSFGDALEFGSDPLLAEAGDNALITENGASGANNITVTVIPEPATLGMMALLGGGILFVRRRLMM